MEFSTFQSKNFTNDGLISLNNLLNSFIGIFNDKRYIYPLRMQFFGFPVSQFDSEGDLYGRIKLLADLLGVPIKIKFMEDTLEDGSKKIQCYMEKEEIKL